MRFLHLADVHLDTPFAGRSPAVRARLREASRQALRRAVDVALSEGVDLVVIAGDLFDGARLSFRTERFLLDELGRLAGAGVPVVYAAGNHDPGREGVRAGRIAWPDNVTVASGPEPVSRVIEREGRPVGRVTAVGHATARVTEDLSRRFPPPRGGLPEVAVLHTQVVGSRREGAHDPYAPSELLHLLGSGYDYWALGHIHLRQVLSESPAVHYPGSPQGLTLAETGARGGLLVDLADRGAPRVEFRALAPVRWETLEVDRLEGEATLDRLVARIGAAWRTAREDDPGEPGTEWLVRVVLSGPTPFWRELDDPEERAAVADAVGASVRALDVTVEARHTHPPLDPGEHLGRQDVLGESLRLVRELREGRASLDGLRASDLAGYDAGSEALEEYVAGLLEGAEPELLGRMLVPDGGEGG